METIWCSCCWRLVGTIPSGCSEGIPIRDSTFGTWNSDGWTSWYHKNIWQNYQAFLLARNTERHIWFLPNMSLLPSCREAEPEPIPAFEKPFSRVIIDCVGPLPKIRSGNSYMLTIMNVSTRFPGATPLRNISWEKVVEALITFFTMVGLPREIQSDQFSNSTSGVFHQIICWLGATQITSSAYHPESQGALERFR